MATARQPQAAVQTAAPAAGPSVENLLLDEMKKAQPDLAKIREWAPQVGINKVFKGGKTLLLLALKKPNMELLDTLLDLGANPELKEAYLHVGNHAKALDMLKRMVAKGLRLDTKQLKPHLEWIINRPLEYIEYVIEQQKNQINILSPGVIYISASGNYNDIAMTPLMFICTAFSPDKAVQDKYTATVDILLKNGADPNIIGGDFNLTALHLALITFGKGGSINPVYKLLDAGADPSMLLSYRSPHYRVAINGKEMPTNKVTPLAMAFALGNKDIFKKLLEKGADVNQPLLDPACPDLLTFAAVVFSKYFVDSNNHKKLFDDLLAIPTLQISDKIVGNAEQGQYAPFIAEKILAKVNKGSSIWKGWTRSDVEKFDLLFTEDGAKAYSCCPVCLKYVARQDGCLYMHHDCSKLTGFYHTGLYNKYNRGDGQIEWCTVCGRICKHHRHYKIDLASNPVPDFAVAAPTDHAVFFANDCRGANGGGGLPEKIERIRALRQFARELQDVVGEIPQTTALEQLTEAMWNAPAASFFGRRAEKILAAKKWNFETANAFPANVLPGAAPVNALAPNIPRPSANVELLPTFAAEGENAVAMEFGVPVVYFHHRLPSGEVKDHEEGVGLPTLITYIQDVNKKFGTDEFGACPLQCGARLHPDEVKKAFELLGDPQEALVAEYRAKYNQRFRAGVGGRRVTRKRTRRV